MLATASTFCKPADGGGWRSLQGLWLRHPFSMKYDIVKLNGRNSWSKIYRYTIEFPKGTYSSGVLEFDRARRWFNRTYGWSTDVKTQNEIAEQLNDQVPSSHQSDDLNLQWAYSTEYRNYRIYVASDKELMFFELAHSGTA
jgi:hypothetical protein